MVVDEARKILRERRIKFLRKIKKHVYYDVKLGTVSEISIALPPKNDALANILFRISANKDNTEIYYLATGDYDKNSSLRGLGLGSFLINEVKRISKEQGKKTITLSCENQLVPFYERLGFVATPSTHKTFTNMICHI